MRTNRRQFIGGALGLGALSAFPMPAIAQSGGTIKIGLITSLQGGYAAFGQNHQRGAQFAVDEINAAGGIGGKKLELVVRDDGLKPDIGIAAARELAADGVRIFTGGLVSGVVLALNGIMGELDSIFVSAAAHGNNLTHEDFKPNYFRVTDYSAMRVGAGSHLVAQRYKDAKVWGSIAPDAEIGRSVMEVVNFHLPRAYKELHGAEVKMTETLWTKFGATDYRNEIARLMSQGIDGLIVGLGGADETTFLQQAGQLGLTKKIQGFFTSGSEFLGAIALKERTPENYWSGFHWYYGAYPDNPIAKRVVDTFREKGYGKHPDGFVGMTHAAISAISAALAKGAGETSKELIPALEGMSFDSVKGKITLRKEDHQAISDVNYALLGPAKNEDGWEVVDFARVDGEPFAGAPTPGQPLKFG